MTKREKRKQKLLKEGGDLEKPTQREWLRKRQWKYPKIEAEQLAEGKKEGEGRENPTRSPQIRPLHNCMFFPRPLE